MHKKPLSSRYPHTMQLATELGKPITFLALEGSETDAADTHGAISEFAVIVIGPFEFPYAVDSFVNPERTLRPDDLLRTGLTAKALATHPTWQELWEGGLGNTVASSLVVGNGDIRQTLALIDTQAARYELPVARWDWVNLLDLFARATGRDWKGNLPIMAQELGVDAPGTARRVVAEPILLARLFEATLAAFGSTAVAPSRHLQSVPLPPAADPFDLVPAANSPRASDLRVVAADPTTDPFELDAFDGDTIPAMTPFYGGAFTLQELVDAMLDRMVADGLVRNYADVIGVLRGLGLVIEKSRDPYQGVVVETAIRAKRRLKGRYYRPNYVAAPSEPAGPATAGTEAASSGQPDMLDLLQARILAGGYQSLEHQLRLVEPVAPHMTRETVAYAVSTLIDQGRLKHETVADETILSWLTDAVRPLVRPAESGGGFLLKPIMTRLVKLPSLTTNQRRRLDYVQLRVALSRLGVPYGNRKTRELSEQLSAEDVRSAL